MCKEKALKRLGYNQDWLNFGIITEEYLMLQYDEIKTSKDQNAEHYRSGGFGAYLRSKDVLTDDEVKNIFVLKDDGPDRCDLHEDRILLLIDSDLLSDIQLESISKYPEVLERPIQKKYLREVLIRRINQTSIEQCFEDVKSTQDSAIHEYVLDKKGLMPSHVEWLAKRGGNKGVRNIAKQLLNSKKFMRKS